MKFETNSLADFESATQNIFNYILEKGNNVVLGLVGNLGAGKTTFSKIFAKKLGVSEEVVSPTFVIMKVYKTNNDLFKEFVHIDAYRISDPLEIDKLKINQYFEKQQTLTIVEWPENIKSKMPANTIFIEILHDQNDPEKRHISLL